MTKIAQMKSKKHRSNPKGIHTENDVSKEKKHSFGSVKNTRKVIYTNITINDNIGKHVRQSWWFNM